jgi:hypothetical protein
VSYAWEVRDQAAIKILADGAARMAFGGIGGDYFFSDRDISPLLELDLGYGGAKDHSSGFALGGGAGYQFFRTSAVTLEVLLHYATIFEPAHENNPGIFGMRVGLCF